jgi:phosphohistidine phosphatase
MKSLLLLRHAKTQPDAPAGDHARHLTKRGERDARTIAEHIRVTTGAPEAIATSDARRAVQTAEIVAPIIGFISPLTVEPRIYAADLDTLLDVVRELPDTADRVILVGHNPGFEELTAALVGADQDEIRLPTSGLAHLAFEVSRWADVGEGTGTLRELTSGRGSG